MLFLEHILSIFIGFSLVNGLISNTAWDADNCENPQGVGICKPVKECKSLSAFLRKAPKPLPVYYKAAIKQYQCKNKNPGVHVCCNSAQIVVPPPNVDSHKNRALLPGDGECSQTKWSSRIVGGNTTGIFEFPWMALLKYQTPDGPDFQCGGTVINNKYILTASHCLVNLGDNKLIGVRVGEHDFSTEQDCELDPKTNETICAPPFQDLGIEEAIPHENYNPKTFQNDIGLIRVATPYIDTSVDNVFPVCLPFGHFNRQFNYEYVRISGWGATDKKSYSAALLKVDVKIVDNDDCQQVYKRQTNITYLQMCAGGKDKKDSCNGDSGGPLYSNGRKGEPVQQGVVSVGPLFCGSEGFPGIYTRVVYYTRWILNHLKP